MVDPSLHMIFNQWQALAGTQPFSSPKKRWLQHEAAVAVAISAEVSMLLGAAKSDLTPCTYTFSVPRPPSMPRVKQPRRNVRHDGLWPHSWLIRVTDVLGWLYILSRLWGLLCIPYLKSPPRFPQRTCTPSSRQGAHFTFLGNYQ